MTHNTAAKWQFSLRALLLFVLAFAVITSGWRILGADVFLGAAFVLLSAAPVGLLKGPLRPAFLVSYFAVYGPFLVMATYTFLYVECSHCKKATWEVLPYGPGIVPVELANHWLGLPRFGNALGTGIALFVSATTVIALTWLVRTRGRWLQALSVAGVLALCTFGAIVVLALIRA
jgi:hypothetical protein